MAAKPSPTRQPPVSPRGNEAAAAGSSPDSVRNVNSKDDSRSQDRQSAPSSPSSPSFRSVSAPLLRKISRRMGGDNSAGTETKNASSERNGALVDRDPNGVPVRGNVSRKEEKFEGDERTCIDASTIADSGVGALNGMAEAGGTHERQTGNERNGAGNTDVTGSNGHIPHADVQRTVLVNNNGSDLVGASTKTPDFLDEGTPAASADGAGSFPGAVRSEPFLMSQSGLGIVVENKATDKPALERPAVQIERTTSNEALPKDSAEDQQPTTSAGVAREREKDKVLKLSPAQIHELTSSPESLALHTIPAVGEPPASLADPASTTIVDGVQDEEEGINTSTGMGQAIQNGSVSSKGKGSRRRKSSSGKNVYLENPPEFLSPVRQYAGGRTTGQRSRTASTPDPYRDRRHSAASDRLPQQPWTSKSKQKKHLPSQLNLEASKPAHGTSSGGDAAVPSPMPNSIPLPPLSVPTYLQLELSSERPSPLYIHRSATSDFPYESSQVKIERLLNFLLLPPSLEQVLFFGTLACLDAWLYSFTILPLRFCKSVFILLQSWATNLGVEAQFISSFVIHGVGRVWRRRNRSSSSASQADGRPHSSFIRQGDSHANGHAKGTPSTEDGRRSRGNTGRSNRHRRKQSTPSALLPDDKADILKGLLMIATCIVLMYFDASRVYHWIRGQAAIKLYVIYNVLEVGDRLLSAIGQDVLECLFSREALERKPDGRSKVVRPFWLFLLALAYTVTHAAALFYQVITLNVAVNSYSNALITLLLSNQFVEIKSTVFKKFEKENLFQLTCADVVERFQLWLMLTIIASRNIVETNSFNLGNSLGTLVANSHSSPVTNSTPVSNPPSSSSILPQSFTLFPSSVFSSFSSVNSFLPSLGHVLGPYFVVLGSEMLVDWLKHAYINKFNNTRPAIYGRFLDILSKDYYTNAFADPNLTRRLGLPIIPLSCLFFRVSVQTYKMFLTAWLPQPPSAFAPSNTTSLTSIHNHYSPSPSPSPLPFSFFDIRGSSVHVSSLFQSLISRLTPSPNAFIPIFTIILILLLYVTLLVAKLILGIALLSFSRARYKAMKTREREQPSSNGAVPTSSSASSAAHPPGSVRPIQSPATAPPFTAGDPDTVNGSRRVGGWGVVEVDDDKRRWIYADDREGLRKLKEREERNAKNASTGMQGIEAVRRYEMVAKRIW